MKALVKVGRGQGLVEYRDVPEPVPGLGELKIGVHAAGICGTDLHILHDAFPYEPPVVLGHEFCGTVVAVGEGITRFKVGDRVAAEAPARICGRCRYCKTGLYNLCANRSGLGTRRNGAFAAFTVVEESMTHAIPPTVSNMAAAIAEPLACCTRAVTFLTPLSPGETVAVIGPGPIGNLTMQLAKASGARVIVLGTASDRARLELAQRLGADRTVDIQADDPLQAVRDFVGDAGVDVVFECSGAPRGAALGLDLVRRGGRYTQVGVLPGSVELNFNLVMLKELRVQGSFSQNWSAWETALGLTAAGKIAMDPLVSHRVSLADWPEAFRLVEAREAMKVVLLPEPA
ncbi:MAG: hypothetical protein A2146_04955 [Actinobacteria bacterium RBG_16_67_10]|nr:MAG: hypothetical protein A2146_04955 [Actinobacteria bacterium RBG_16_67_10]